MCGATRCAVAYSSGAGAAEVYDGEVAAEQMRCKPERPELSAVLRIRFANQNVYHIVIGGCALEYKKRATFRPSACAPLLGLEPRTP